MSDNIILVNRGDNVAVAIVEIREGERISGAGAGDLTARADIPKNHKVAMVRINEGGEVIKYGEPIGTASKPIEAGDWVHVHNLRSEDK